MAKSERQQRYIKGRQAERWTAWRLRFKGYRILAERYKTPVGEIDLIARKSKTIIFIEVKARGTIEDGKEAVTFTQRRRIEKAAELFLASYVKPYDGVQFDVIVASGLKIMHQKAAWRMGD